MDLYSTLSKTSSNMLSLPVL